jgi:hypothetical protein
MSKTKSKTKITIANDTELVTGSKHLYKSWSAAMRQSRSATTNPGVTEFNTGDCTYYAADGDHWIRDDGSRGQYLYGRGGQLLEVLQITA